MLQNIEVQNAMLFNESIHEGRSEELEESLEVLVLGKADVQSPAEVPGSLGHKVRGKDWRI